MKKYVYEVPILYPIKNSFAVGAYNFNVFLDGNLGVLAREKEMEEDTYNIFKQDGIEIVKSYLSKIGKKYNEMPYHFVEGSWLVHSICVPGDACDLSLSEMSMRDFLYDDWEELKSKDNAPIWVDYTGHNIDSLNQARCLRELFIHWANTANNCLNYN